MRVVYLCPRCGSVLVDRGGEPRRLELAATRQPTLANWRSYAHQTLTAAEWQRIAAGGASDAALEKADLAQAMSELREGRVTLQTSAACPIPLTAGEQALFVLPSVSLREPEAVRTGTCGGLSLRVDKGLIIRSGAFAAQSNDESKEIDSGTLVLTDKRLCFAGKLRSLECDLRRLISVEPYADAVGVRRSGNEHTEFFFGIDCYKTYSFAIDSRHYSEPMSGLILKYVIEGLLARP